jgi:peptide deformylase
MYGDPVLRETSSPLVVPDERIRRLATDMIDTMRVERGVGLAAQQVGLAEAICVVEVPPDYDVDEQGVRQNPDRTMPMVLVNPRILDHSAEESSAEEGCLSFPNITGAIKRPVSIRLHYLDLDGAEQECDVTGFVARVVQHELDHLNGVLFIDRMTPVRRTALSGRLKRMRRDTRERIGIA